MNNVEYFKQAGYGMMMHFGLYSLLGGEYKGKVGHRYAEWIMAHFAIPNREYEQLASVHSTVLVDGCGPWETPLTSGVSMADFAESIGLPVILVVNNRPGAAGLSKLTIDSIQKRGLVCKGIILNHIGEEWSTASVTNSRVISELTGVPVLAELIHGQDYIDAIEILN